MSRRAILLASALVMAIVGAVAFFAGGDRAARGSSLSRGAEGWLAARAYLKARGASVRLLDRPQPPPDDGVVVETFPWQRAGDGSLSLIRLHLLAGGTVVAAYSGGDGESETSAFEGLGAPLRRVRGAVPTSPRAWWRFVTAEWHLTAARPQAGPGSELAIPAPDWMPTAPAGADVLYRAPGGKPAAFAFTRSRGRVVVVPAAALANAGLGEAGNADLLETLFAGLGDRWSFDEYAHGLAAVASAEVPSRVVDLVAVHLAVLYLLGVLALARRFGPSWREPPAITGSTAGFLLGLGALHHQLGHHRQAGEMLVDRVAALEGRAPATAMVTADGATLVRLARSLAGPRGRRNG